MERLKSFLRFVIPALKDAKVFLITLRREQIVQYFKRFLESIFNVAMYVNILAMMPQPLQILKSQNAINVSLWTWVVFFVFQTAVSLHGKLNLQSRSMFLGMGGSAIISFITVVLCCIYG